MFAQPFTLNSICYGVLQYTISISTAFYLLPVIDRQKVALAVMSQDLENSRYSPTLSSEFTRVKISSLDVQKENEHIRILLFSPKQNERNSIARGKNIENAIQSLHRNNIPVMRWKWMAFRWPRLWRTQVISKQTRVYSFIVSLCPVFYSDIQIDAFSAIRTIFSLPWVCSCVVLTCSRRAWQRRYVMDNS